MFNFNSMYNKAFYNLHSKQFDIAISIYNNILKNDPSFTQAWFDLAYIYLLKKDFKKGWKYYEKRLNFTKHTLQTNPLLDKNRLWTDQLLKNKTILIFYEQGFGDTIQFVRFITNFIQKYPHTKIIFYIQKRLKELILYNCPNILIIDNLENIQYDYCVSLLSLPYKLGYKFHLPIKSYLTPKPNELKLPKNIFKVGICWQGNKNNTRDKYRSIDISLLLSILPQKNIKLYSLQKDIKINNKNIDNTINKCENFNDSANLISQLDLVITVDTSIVHLAGALGVKTYLLLPYLSDFRWGQNDTQSYWYQNIFIFRQVKINSWVEPLLELKHAIKINLGNNFKSFVNNALFYQKENSLELSNFYFKKALKKDRFAPLYIGLGNNFLKQNKIKKAKRSFKKAIKLDDSLYEAYFDIANIFNDKYRFKKAIKYYKKALKLHPKHIQSLHNLANAYQRLDKLKTALKYYKKVLDIDPSLSSTLESLGGLYKDFGKLKKSIKYYKKALSLDQNNPYIHTNLSVSLIMNKDFTSGWKEFEYRWHLEDFKALRAKSPGRLWNKEDLNNKTLLIFTEQGFGDNIQFIRLVVNIKQLYPKVNIVVKAHKSLVKLFSNIPQIDKIISFDDKFNQYDFVVPLMSLPYMIKLTFNTIPNKIPYILIKKKNILLNNKKLKVGIVWAGSKSHKSNANRTINLSNFKILFNNKSCQFYSLQVEKAREELKQIDANIIDLGKDLKNFYDTALLLKNLDLVITIDTSVAHLSGALNIPTWVVLPYRPGYLWLKKGKYSPWYPSIILFRQKKFNHWETIFKKINKKLERLCQKRKK